jgi:hypothetical protein
MMQNAAQRKYLASSHGKAKVRAYKQANRARIATKAAERRKIKRQYVALIKSNPCTDCKQTYPWYVMDLDHVTGEKHKDVSSLIDNNVSLEIIMLEVAKCEVVCSNCHRERTWKRKSL